MTLLGMRLSEAHVLLDIDGAAYTDVLISPKKPCENGEARVIRVSSDPDRTVLYYSYCPVLREE